MSGTNARRASLGPPSQTSQGVQTRLGEGPHPTDPPPGPRVHLPHRSAG